MTLNPIESSVIIRAGYDPELRFFRAVMQDGSVYDVAPVTAAEYAEFMAAPSKGIHWFRAFAARAFRSGEPPKPTPIKLREPARPSQLQTHDGEDPCCGPKIGKAIADGKLESAASWSCPVCGSEYRPVMVNSVRHWRPHEEIAVFRG